MVLRQILTLARHEFRCHVSTPRVRALLGLVALIAPVVACVSLQDYQSRSADQQRLAQQRLIDRQQEQRLIPGFQPDRSLRALRTPSSLAILVRGLDGELPPYWDLSPAGPTAGRPSRDTAGVQERNATLDMELLVRVLLGFLAVTLGAETVALDRQRGTLKILFSQALPGPAIGAAKLLSGAAVLFVGVATMWTTTLGILAFAAPDLLSGELVGVSISIMGIGLVYLITLFAAGMLIGQSSRSYSAANVTAGIAWLVITFILIPVTAFVARVIAQAPNRSSVEAARDERFSVLTRTVEEDLGTRLMELIGSQGNPRAVTLQSSAGVEINRLWNERMAAAHREMAQFAQAVADRRSRGERWARAMALANPAALVLEVSADLAGTGSRTAQRLEHAVEEYQRALDHAVFGNRPRIHLRVPSDRGVSLEVIERGPVPTVGQLPAFAERMPDWSTRLKDSSGLLAVLLAYLVVAATLTCASFRYKPMRAF